MKKLLFAAMIMIPGLLCAQAKQVPKKDSIGSSGDAIRQRQYFIVLYEDQWRTLFDIIRSSDELSSNRANKVVQSIQEQLHELPAIADTAKKRK